MERSDPLEQTRYAFEETLTRLREAHQKDELELPPIERRWLDILSAQLDTVPQEEEALQSAVQQRYGTGVFIPEDYQPHPG